MFCVFGYYLDISWKPFKVETLRANRTLVNDVL